MKRPAESSAPKGCFCCRAGLVGEADVGFAEELGEAEVELFFARFAKEPDGGPDSSRGTIGLVHLIAPGAMFRMHHGVIKCFHVRVTVGNNDLMPS